MIKRFFRYSLLSVFVAVASLFGLLLVGCPQNDKIKNNDAIQIQKWENQFKIIASDADNFDYFGTSVAISGDYAIIGASGEDGAGGDRGAGYIFHRTINNIWDEGFRITAFDAANNDYFGTSVSISGNLAIVGAINENGAGSMRGAGYIFYRTGTNMWDIQTKIIAPDAADSDYFGGSVAISGDYAIAGAAYEDGAGSDRGAAYIFHRSGANVWDTGVKITAFDAVSDDNFGTSVAISGDYAIVGAINQTGSARGACYIFHRTGTNTWDPGIKITASDAADLDFFGFSVAISGDYAIVGAVYKNSGGACYIFHRTGTNTWDTGVKITALDASDGDNFGASVGISGDYAIVGAAYKDGIGTNSGAGYIFHRSGANTWDAGIKIIASDAADSDYFGNSVALSGDYVVAGASHQAGSDRGAAYIFK